MHKAIPEDVKRQVERIVEEFNRTAMDDPHSFYVPSYRGLYLYLHREDEGTAGPICRLKYTGEIDAWAFAIYEYSDERYDPEEWFFPGAEEVDGAVEGAMKAGMKAYP